MWFSSSFLRRITTAFFRLIFPLIAAIVSAWGTITVWDTAKTIEFRLFLQNPKNQFITLHYASVPVFRPDSEQRRFLPASEQEQEVVFRLPRISARNLRLAFSAPSGIITLYDPVLNGRPLSIDKAFDYQKRNIRSCAPSENIPGALLCRLAGENGWLAFSPDSVKEALYSPLHTAIGCIWVVIFFIFFQRSFPFFLDYLRRRKAGPALLVITSILFFPLLYTALKYCSCRQIFIGTDGPTLQWLFSDAIIPALILGALAVCAFFRQHLIQLLSAAFSLGILLLQTVDFLLIYTLNARLDLFQAASFSRDLISALPLVKAYLCSPCGLFLLFLAADWLCLLIMALHRQSRKHCVRATLTAAILLGLFYSAGAVLPASAKTLEDLPRFYLRRIVQNADTSTIPADTNGFTPVYRCEKGLNGRQNIILLVVESLSSYMSDYFSGMNDNTPEIDRLARENLAFVNYHTNNYNTVQSLFNILTGFPLLHAHTDRPVFLNEKFYQHAVPALFRNAGYHTVLFSSAAFVYSKDEILKRAGFDELYNDTDPFYEGKERFVFNSVSDQWLYQRVQHWLKNDCRQPYFLVIETTSSHAPYLDPASHYNSFPRSLQFADKYAGEFVRWLEKDGFFENGLLVITGDHRAMLPVSQQQYDTLGPDAESHIPLVIMGAGLKGRRTVKGSHTDLGASLEYLTLPQACFHQFQHNLFSPASKRNSCTLFQTLTLEKKALADCGGTFISFRLLPGSNKIFHGKLPAEQAAELMAFMSWLRENNTY